MEGKRKKEFKNERKYYERKGMLIVGKIFTTRINNIIFRLICGEFREFMNTIIHENNSEERLH